MSPVRPHPGFPSPRGSVVTFLSLVPRPSPQICLRKSSLLPACYCLQLQMETGREERPALNLSSQPSSDEPPAPLQVTTGEFSPEMGSIDLLLLP